MSQDEADKEQWEAEKFFDNEAQALISRQIYRRKPKSVDKVISQFLAQTGINQTRSIERIRNVWQSVVDKKFAGLSMATGIRSRKLMVVVKSAIAHQELTTQKKELLKKLKETELGSRISEIRFKLGSF